MDNMDERRRLFKVYRSDIPGEEADHSIMSMPYIAREGTLKAAHAVRLDIGTARLWGSDSRYRKYADPALVLPGKYNRDGTRIVSTDNNAAAMQVRRVRYYVPDIDINSDKSLLAGLTYKIRVPLYNAGFKAAGNFSARLSYVLVSNFGVFHPDRDMKALQTIRS